eukprot:TRINITY_DN7984_c1_g4_i1.p1 TRINITY_DN7984_c1_g4~~TRINITY_DN7984_c1_g4_i1.p1  ORF type:complete len:680 (+),score=219.80 TRINITY_DN7984_c1_g4_i1:161-2200(+)
MERADSIAALLASLAEFPIKNDNQPSKNVASNEGLSAPHAATEIASRSPSRRAEPEIKDEPGRSHHMHSLNAESTIGERKSNGNRAPEEDADADYDSDDQSEFQATTPKSNGAMDMNDDNEKKRGRDEDWRPLLDKKKHRNGNHQLPPRKKRSISPSPSSPQDNNASPPATPKKSELGKLSFQEAAVRVLGDQRNKNVWALSTRKIWDLIAQSGLVDTKCKTPVSSLSSRITEDVRTKGNKSVFLRVGEGLYTLRKGLKKQELEKFLTTKYPHMPHNLEGVTFNEKNADGDEDADVDEEVNGDADVDGDADADMEEEEEKEEEKSKEIQLTSWIGLPLKVKTNGDICYACVKSGKYKYRIGDCAYFTPNSGDKTPYVGQITKFWQANNPNAPNGNKMYVQCVWYYYPEDTYSGRTKRHHKKEVFLSDLSDVNTVDSLIRPVSVFDFHEFSKRSSPSKNGEEKDVYFCRYFYSENTKKFHVLNQVPMGNHYHIESFKEEEQFPENWPKSVHFSRKILWRDISEMVRDYLSSSQVPTVEIQEIEATGGSEFGLFAARDISRGSIIGEYTGYLSINDEVQDEIQDEIQDESDDEKSNGNGGKKVDKFRRVLFEDEEVSVSIDAAMAGNEMRYIRQPRGKEAANSKFVSVALNGEWRLIVMATTDIPQGIEILAGTETVSQSD